MLVCGCAILGFSDPQLVTKTSGSPMQIHSVTTPDPGAVVPSEIAVRFSPAFPDKAPRHLRRYDERHPACLHVERGQPMVASEAGPMSEFQPTTWSLAVFDGEHLEGPTNVARISFGGQVRQESVGRVVDPAEVPSTLRDTWIDPSRVPHVDAERTALDGFAAQDWVSILAPAFADTDSRQTAVAWMGPGGDIVKGHQVSDLVLAAESSPDALGIVGSIRLLGRVDAYGVTTWVSIPLPVLLNAKNLEFRRADADHLWFVRNERWNGHFERNTRRTGEVAYALPLANDIFEYDWREEFWARQPGLIDTARERVLAPFRLIAQLLMISPAVRNFVEWLFPELAEDPRKPIEAPDRR